MPPSFSGSIEHTIHLPQDPKKVILKSLGVFLEVALVPAAIIASLGGAGQVTLAIMAVFVWRIIVSLCRIALFGLLPATSILTFLLLTARTGAGGAMGVTESGSPLIAYVLPGCIVSALAGVYFMRSSFGDKPLAMKLAKDFVDLSPESTERLLPLYKRITLTIGVLNSLMAALAATILFVTPEKTASVLTSCIGVAGPLLMLVACLYIATGFLRSTQTRISFKACVEAESNLFCSKRG